MTSDVDPKLASPSGQGKSFDKAKRKSVRFQLPGSPAGLRLPWAENLHFVSVGLALSKAQAQTLYVLCQLLTSSVQFKSAADKSWFA